MKKYLIAILAILFWAGWASAATLTVCSSGCDETTIQAVFDNNDLAPADIVEIRADTPGGSVSFSERAIPGDDDDGDAGDQLVIRGRAGDTVTIEGDNTRAQCILANASTNYITLSNLTLKDATDEMLSILRSSNWLIDSVTFVRTSGTAVGLKLYADATAAVNDTTISNSAFTSCQKAIYAFVAATNTIHTITIDTNTFTTSVTQDIEFFMNDGTRAAGLAPYGITVTDNTSTRPGDQFIRLRSADTAANLISGNTITEAGYGGGFATNAMQLHWCKNLIVEDNVITTIDNSAGDGSGIILDWDDDGGGNSADYMCENVIVRNNKISGANSNAAAAGINVFYAKGSDIHNNVIYGSYLGISHGNDESTGNSISSNTIDGCTQAIRIHVSSPIVIVENNILTDSDYGIRVASDPYTNPVEDFNEFNNMATYNYWNNTASAEITLGSNSITTDPLFLDEATGNFAPLSTSPNIDDGTETYTYGPNVQAADYDMEDNNSWFDFNTPTVNAQDAVTFTQVANSRKFTADAANDGITATNQTVETADYIVLVSVYPDDTTDVSVRIRDGDNNETIVNETVTGLTQDAWNTVKIEYSDDAGTGGWIAFLATGAGTWYVDDLFWAKKTIITTDYSGDTVPFNGIASYPGGSDTEDIGALEYSYTVLESTSNANITLVDETGWTVYLRAGYSGTFDANNTAGTLFAHPSATLSNVGSATVTKFNGAAGL